MDERDWSQEKGIADESHFNEFVQEVGGELVAPLITRPGVLNADYLFRSDQIVGEHKILETDFAYTPETLERVDAARAQYAHDQQLLGRELFSILRKPIRRIVEKANKQIKSTKLELGLRDHRGVLFLVNDNFKSADPIIVRGLIESILNEKERYRSIDGVVYLTNHYIEVSESPDACLLWSPVYKTRPSNHLVEFIDGLGRLWSSFMNQRIGPFDSSISSDTVDWERAYVVKGTRRVERFEGDS